MLTKQELLAALNSEICFIVIIFTSMLPYMPKHALINPFTDMTFYTVSNIPSICHFKPSNLTLFCLQLERNLHKQFMTHFTGRQTQVAN